MDHPGRVRRLQQRLAQSRLDAFLVTHLANIRYLCGFTGSAGALVLSERRCVFFTDGRYASQAGEEVRAARVAINRKAPLLAAAEWPSRMWKKAGVAKPRTLGIEGEHLSVAARQRLVDALPSGFRLRALPPLVEQARMIKDKDEIECIRQAVLLGASLFEVVLKRIRPGVKETEVAAELEYAARKAGAQDLSFSPIIAAGERSALPHGRASEHPIPTQGAVVCDFGVILAGYCSDMTRTVFMGRASAEVRRLYQAVREAQQAGIDAVRPGASCAEVDHAARNSLKKNKLTKFFTHSTGHGVGLEIHEAPRVASGDQAVLRPGTVITVEPGVYIPGKWGIRIEDMVVVTEAACEVLTPTSKELIEI